MMQNLLKYTSAFLLMLIAGNGFAQTNIALTATASHSGGGATTYSAANYNDNNWNTTCANTPWGWVSTNGWIEFTWSAPEVVGKMVFYKSDRPMTQCTIQYWDGTTYQNIMNYSGSSCEDSVIFTTPVRTTKIRLNAVAGSSNPNHREIFIYGPPCSTAVTAQPVSTTVCENTDATFSISAIDVTEYQWQVDEGSGFASISDGSLYSGTATNTLTVKNTPSTINNYQYRCLIAKIVCADTSNAATLNVLGLVKLANIAANDTACKNTTKEITVGAQGSILAYQWQMYSDAVGGYVDVPNQPPFNHLANKLQIQNVPDSLNNARFRLRVNGMCDSSVSGTTKLIVNAIPKVATVPDDEFAKPGETVEFEVSSTSPFNTRYQWQAAPAANGDFVNINDGGIYDGTRKPRLRVYGVSRVQDQFKFRCVIQTSDACIAPGDTSSFALLSVEPPVGVAELPVGKAVTVYPNPANGTEFYIKLDLNSMADAHYRITDEMGRVVKTGDIDSEQTSVSITDMPAGVYMIYITNADQKVISQTKLMRL